MNPLQAGLLVVLVVFALLWLKFLYPLLAIRFGRAVILGLASITVLVAPFVRLLSAVFKDRTVLNEYMFFPPLSESGCRRRW
ncbi:MAG: hypothetical protein QM784_23550 [Polyangiaceae bacterium]